MNSQKFTVWCGLWARGIIDWKMLNDLLFNETKDLDLDDVWFQQDGPTCQTACETLTVFQTKFPGRVIFQRKEWIGHRGVAI